MRDLEPACTVPYLGPDVYSRWRRSELGATTERLERELVLELVGNVEGCRVLDLGCCDGTLAVALDRRGAEVVGLDPSQSMLDAARAHGARATFCRGRAERLSFSNASFDKVVAVTVLCFVNDAVPMFREIGRVLRPGGRLVIGELGKWSTWAAARRVRAWARYYGAWAGFEPSGSSSASRP